MIDWPRSPNYTGLHRRTNCLCEIDNQRGVGIALASKFHVTGERTAVRIWMGGRVGGQRGFPALWSPVLLVRVGGMGICSGGAEVGPAGVYQMIPGPVLG